MIRVVCCDRYMVPKVNGVWFVERSGGEIHRVWHTDKMICPACNRTVLAGFGKAPVYEMGARDENTAIINTNAERFLAECRGLGDEVVESA